jgi:hypothetical protein
MTFKEFLQREFTAGVSISQMNPNTLGARAVNKELKSQMPTRLLRQTGKTSVGRAMQGMLGTGRPALPTPERGPSIKSNLDQKPRRYNTEPRFKQVKSPLGLLNQQSSAT